MFDFPWFNWSGVSIRSKQLETLDRSLYCKDVGNTRVGSSAVSMSSPLVRDTEKTYKRGDIGHLQVLNDASNEAVRRLTKDILEIKEVSVLKDGDIEEFRRTVESLLIKKNQVEIELECTRSQLEGEHEAYLNVSCLLHEILETRSTEVSASEITCVDDIKDGPQGGPEYHAASTSFSDMLDAEAEKLPEEPDLATLQALLEEATNRANNLAIRHYYHIGYGIPQTTLGGATNESCRHYKKPKRPGEDDSESPSLLWPEESPPKPFWAR